jgi:hypothetical protein
VTTYSHLHADTLGIVSFADSSLLRPIDQRNDAHSKLSGGPPETYDKLPIPPCSPPNPNHIPAPFIPSLYHVNSPHLPGSPSFVTLPLNPSAWGWTVTRVSLPGPCYLDDVEVSTRRREALRSMRGSKRAETNQYHQADIRFLPSRLKGVFTRIRYLHNRDISDSTWACILPGKSPHSCATARV